MARIERGLRGTEGISSIERSIHHRWWPVLELRCICRVVIRPVLPVLQTEAMRGFEKRKKKEIAIDRSRARARWREERFVGPCWLRGGGGTEGDLFEHQEVRWRIVHRGQESLFVYAQRALQVSTLAVAKFPRRRCLIVYTNS